MIENQQFCFFSIYIASLSVLIIFLKPNRKTVKLLLSFAFGRFLLFIFFYFIYLKLLFMKNHSFLIFIGSLICCLLLLNNCKSNKIPCPTYKDSFVEKKKKVKPGAQKPEMPKSTKTKSGVLPPKR